MKGKIALRRCKEKISAVLSKWESTLIIKVVEVDQITLKEVNQALHLMQTVRLQLIELPSYLLMDQAVFKRKTLALFLPKKKA